MPPLRHWLHRILRLLGFTLATAVIAAAVLLTLARLLLPFTDTLRPNIAAWAEKALGRPVSIGRLDADWRGLEPGLILIDTTLLDDHGRPLIHLQHARIGLDLWASLRRASLTPGRIHLTGLRLAVVRDSEGRLQVAGLDSGPQRPGAGRDFARWLLSHPRISVEDSEIHYRDESNGQEGGEWAFHHVTLDLRNRRDRHLIEGTVELPYRMGYGIDLALDLTGDILSAHDWAGRGYLSIRGLQMNQLPRLWRTGPINLEQGRLDLQLWSWWKDGNPQRINGTVTLRDLTLLRRKDHQLLTLSRLGGVVDWQRDERGAWWLAVQRLRLETDDREALPTRLWLHHRPAEDGEPALWEVAADHLRLDDLIRLARFSDRLPGTAREQLDRLQPQGRMDDLRLTVVQDTPLRYRLSGRLKGLRNTAWQWIPGSDGIDGEIHLDERGGEARFHGRRIHLTLERLYRAPLPLDRLTGHVRWRRAPRAWVVDLNGLNTENRYLALASRIRLNLPTDGRSPRLILASRLRLPQADQLRTHLPRRILSPPLRRWLDGALHAAAVEDGQILYLGRTHQFPFPEDQGRLAIRLDLRQGRLTPALGWPTIDDIQGRLRVDHHRLTLEDASGRIYHSRLHDVTVTLPNIQAPKRALTVTGQVESNAQDVLRYLHHSPLEDAFATALHPFQAEGPTHLDLTLAIPLFDAPVTVRGKGRLDGVHLRSAEYLIDLRELRGPLRFTSRGIWSEGLEGRMDDLPLRLTLETQTTPHQLQIGGKGRIHREALRQLLNRYTDYPHWADYSAGQTRWTGRITIPLAADGPPLHLRIQSKLQGLAITLPAPLAKTSETARPFTLDMGLGEERRNLELEYGDVKAHLTLRQAGERWRLWRGAVGLGREPVFPEEDGIWFTGHVPHFSWSAWSRVLFPEDSRPPLFPDEGTTTLGQYYDVTVNDLEVFDFHFEDVAIQAADSAQGWTIHTRAPRLAGTIFVPMSVTTAPLSMDMRRLHLRTPPAEERTPSTTRPSELPAFVIDADDFRFDRLRFGRLALRASRIPRGLRLDRLSMRTSVTDIQAHGQWLEPPPGSPGEGQRSRFHIESDSDDLGRTLREWDYAGTIEGGRGRIVIDASWPGNPAQFDLARLEGRLKLELENGRLLEIEPGAARIFGLISLQALPRRLALDFSDLFDKGFAFDRITGEYRVRDGIATTQGLIMEGPAGRVIARGKIDLARRRYDQEVAVIPPLGKSLPLIGTAITGAPPVGATLLLLQKLLEKPLSELSTIRYRVTGSWNAPRVERIHDKHETGEEFLSDE